jgi:hypothetical protein
MFVSYHFQVVFAQVGQRRDLLAEFKQLSIEFQESLVSPLVTQFVLEFGALESPFILRVR